jgi:hypothetical protein
MGEIETCSSSCRRGDGGGRSISSGADGTPDASDDDPVDPEQDSDRCIYNNINIRIIFFVYLSVTRLRRLSGESLRVQEEM